MQVIKCELLSHSLDPNIVALYKTRESLNAKLKRVWKATNIVKQANMLTPDSSPNSGSAISVMYTKTLL